MSNIILRQSAVDKLMSDPEVRQWCQTKSGPKAPLLGYYRRSYSTSHDGTVTEYGDGFALSFIDPDDRNEIRGVVIKSVAVTPDFDILVAGDESMMSGSFAIGWSKKFTYEPNDAPSLDEQLA